MKFEKLLQIYWAKGFLYSGDIVPFEVYLKKLYNNFPGLAFYSFTLLKKKMELSYDAKKNPLCSELTESQCRTININLAHLTNVKLSIEDFSQTLSVRYFLVKAYRGRCQAINKPSRGQRTWSNAATARKGQNFIKSYIATFKKNHVKVEAIKKINFKVTQRKLRKAPPKFTKVKTIRKPATEWL